MENSELNIPMRAFAGIAYPLFSWIHDTGLILFLIIKGREPSNPHKYLLAVLVLRYDLCHC